MSDFLFLGMFFVLPFIDDYTRVDLRTQTYDVPPQEVSYKSYNIIIIIIIIIIFFL